MPGVYDVAIIGYGPSGAVAAALLGQAGLSTFVCDRQHEVYDKPRAIALIDELEPVRRGFYGGAIGYLDFAGNMDFAIAIRTALIENGVAHVQAGAGIVADSVPATEAQETRDKAAAMLRAVSRASRLRPGSTH